MTGVENPHIIRAREVKAAKLVTVLERARCTSAGALLLTDHGWAQAARLAGVHDPSPVTRELVVDLLAAREATRARLAAWRRRDRLAAS